MGQGLYPVENPYEKAQAGMSGAGNTMGKQIHGPPTPGKTVGGAMASGATMAAAGATVGSAMAAGATTGTAFGPGYGTAIGAVVGLVAYYLS
jgi:hypothetical protein